MLGLHMLIHSLMAGFAIFLIASLFVGMSVGFLMALTFLTIVTLIFHLITLAIELTTTHTTDDAHAAVTNDHQRRIQPRILARNDPCRQHFAFAFAFDRTNLRLSL